MVAIACSGSTYGHPARPRRASAPGGSGLDRSITQLGGAGGRLSAARSALVAVGGPELDLAGDLDRPGAVGGSPIAAAVALAVPAGPERAARCSAAAALASSSARSAPLGARRRRRPGARATRASTAGPCPALHARRQDGRDGQRGTGARRGAGSTARGAADGAGAQASTRTPGALTRRAGERGGVGSVSRDDPPSKPRRRGRSHEPRVAREHQR